MRQFLDPGFDLGDVASPPEQAPELEQAAQLGHRQALAASAVDRGPEAGLGLPRVTGVEIASNQGLDHQHIRLEPRGIAGQRIARARWQAAWASVNWPLRRRASARAAR